MMIEPEPTDVMPTMNPATAPRTIVGIGRRTTSGRDGRAAPSPSGSAVLPHLEQRAGDEAGRGRDQERQPEQRLEERVELLAARLEADEPGPEERRRARTRCTAA